LYSAVLVALDGSEAAAAAVPRALEAARAFLVRLVLLRVVPPIGEEGSPQREYYSLQSQAEGYLESLKRSLRTRGVKIESIVESGEPASVILSTAQSLGTPLVVITAYGRKLHNGSDDIGSVARAVLRDADAPVLFVRPPLRPDESAQI
jgi:nucleotide-binding universal stress UspA family protein